MKDYIKDGLQRYLAPPAIYEEICRELEKKHWTAEERAELLKQKDKAEQMAIMTRDIFKFP